MEQQVALIIKLESLTHYMPVKKKTENAVVEIWHFT